MAGVKGRSGGHNRLSPAEHLRRNTFKPSRHGSRAAARAALALLQGGRQGHPLSVGATARQPDGVPDPPAALVAGLDGRGRELVLALWSDYEQWSAAKLVLLHELGGVADMLARYEAMAMADATAAPGELTNQSETVARLRAQAQRTFTLFLSKLDLKE